MTLLPLLNLILILRYLILFVCVTFRAIIEPFLFSTMMLFALADIWVVVFAGRSDEEFVAALENNGNPHGDNLGICIKECVDELGPTVYSGKSVSGG